MHAHRFGDVMQPELARIAEYMEEEGTHAIGAMPRLIW